MPEHLASHMLDLDIVKLMAGNLPVDLPTDVRRMTYAVLSTVRQTSKNVLENITDRQILEALTYAHNIIYGQLNELEMSRLRHPSSQVHPRGTWNHDHTAPLPPGFTEYQENLTLSEKEKLLCGNWPVDYRNHPRMIFHKGQPSGEFAHNDWCRTVHTPGPEECPRDELVVDGGKVVPFRPVMRGAEDPPGEMD